MNFAKFLRTPFLTEHLRWLLLRIRSFSFIINKVNGYIDEHNGNKYLTLLHNDKGKEALKNMENYVRKLKILLDEQVIAQATTMKST